MKQFPLQFLAVLILLPVWGCGLIPMEKEDTSSTSPLTGVTAIAAGGLHSCALMSDNNIRCWGSNLEGQLGDGTIVSKSYPVKVSGINSATQLASSYHTCALLADNTSQCWGRGINGQLGNNNTNSSRIPVVVSGLNSKSIDTAPGYSCAVLTDNTTQCWGSYIISSSIVPQNITGISTATAVSVGFLHTCALLSDSTVQCWGYNNQGQLGDRTKSLRTTPSNVLNWSRWLSRFYLWRVWFV